MNIQAEGSWEYLRVQAHYDKNKNKTVISHLNGQLLETEQKPVLNLFIRHLEEEGWHLDTCEDGTLNYKRRQQSPIFQETR